MNEDCKKEFIGFTSDWTYAGDTLQNFLGKLSPYEKLTFPKNYKIIIEKNPAAREGVYKYRVFLCYRSVSSQSSSIINKTRKAK